MSEKHLFFVLRGNFSIILHFLLSFANVLEATYVTKVRNVMLETA